MTKVAKLVIIDNQNKYLLMHRGAHPTFGNDPDLPGGTLEPDEEPLEAMVREVFEEAGIMIDGSITRKLYEGEEYSTHGTHYTLYLTKLDNRPEVAISWEHSSYEWLDQDAFLEKAKAAKDTYMHMVYEQLK